MKGFTQKVFDLCIKPRVVDHIAARKILLLRHNFMQNSVKELFKLHCILHILYVRYINKLIIRAGRDTNFGDGTVFIKYQ